MRIERIHSIDGIEIKEAWIRLSNLDKYANNPFLAYRFEVEWEKQNLKFHKYQVNHFVFYEGSRIVGILPISIRSIGVLKLLYFAGDDFHDYNDLIIEDGYDDQVLQVLFKELHINECIVMRGLREDSILYSIISKFCPRLLYITTISPYHDVTSSNMPKASTRKDIIYNIRRLQRTGNLKLEDVSTSPERCVELEALIQMHKAEWHFKNQRSIFDNAAICNYYYSALLNEEDELNRTYLLKLVHNDTTIAMAYGQIRGATLFYYKPAYSLSYAKYSPGKLLIWYLIEFWKEKKGLFIDFLVGNEEYKFDWCSNYVNIYTSILTKKRVLNYFTIWVFKIRDWKNGRISNVLCESVVEK